MFPLFLPHNIIMIIITMIHSWPIVLLILLSIWPHTVLMLLLVLMMMMIIRAAEYIIQSVCFGYFISSGESVVHQTPQKSIKRPPSTWNSYFIMSVVLITSFSVYSTVETGTERTKYTNIFIHNTIALNSTVFNVHLYHLTLHFTVPV